MCRLDFIIDVAHGEMSLAPLPPETGSDEQSVSFPSPPAAKAAHTPKGSKRRTT